ncbi:hypothetical protein EMIT0P12_50422 [Pseudomonas sp. IT-P12]
MFSHGRPDAHANARMHQRHAQAWGRTQEREGTRPACTIDTLPALDHSHLAAQRLFGQFDHPVVNLLAVEGRGVAAVVVGIADDQFAVRRRADQQVDAVVVQVRFVAKDLRLHRRRFRQIGEGAVMHAAQPGEQCVLQVEIDLWPGAEHLQAADARFEFGDRLRQQRLIIVTGANDDLLGAEGARRAVQAAWLDVAHQGGEVELDLQLAAQVVDQRRQRLAGIQLLVVQAMQRGAVMAELAAVQVAQRRALQQFDAVTVLHGATRAERLEQMLLCLGAGEQVGAVTLEVQAGELRPLSPDVATGLGQFEHRARRLAGDQGLAEVAHRSAQRRFAAFENADLQAAPGGGVGVGQAEDAGADDQHVVVLGHLKMSWIDDRYREQARSHNRSVLHTINVGASLLAMAAFLPMEIYLAATFSDLPS